ncbi:hypothetical protein NBRC111894_4021 [Sporolactobacillus inulinus]|uniref:Uncharacterized protein n=1 Tax=Sporolactobacillus inulinus TaxID=2078 RepID=A0A4Y1ZH28_9BACL|nr:hypothetical protein NBRC111894_4021 [Sporolactobacillus inulinus]
MLEPDAAHKNTLEIWKLSQLEVTICAQSLSILHWAIH